MKERKEKLRRTMNVKKTGAGRETQNKEDAGHAEGRVKSMEEEEEDEELGVRQCDFNPIL